MTAFWSGVVPAELLLFWAEALGGRKSDSGSCDYHHEPHKVGGLPHVLPDFILFIYLFFLCVPT